MVPSLFSATSDTTGVAHSRSVSTSRASASPRKAAVWSERTASQSPGSSSRTRIGTHGDARRSLIGTRVMRIFDSLPYAYFLSLQRSVNSSTLERETTEGTWTHTVRYMHTRTCALVQGLHRHRCGQSLFTSTYPVHDRIESVACQRARTQNLKRVLYMPGASSVTSLELPRQGFHLQALAQVFVRKRRHGVALGRTKGASR